MVDNQDKSILYGRLVVYRAEACHRLPKKAVLYQQLIMATADVAIVKF